MESFGIHFEASSGLSKTLLFKQKYSVRNEVVASYEKFFRKSKPDNGKC